MTCANLKRALSKKWKRVTESRYTIAFVITSIIQTLILVFLQFRLLSRNANLYLDIIHPFVENSEQNDCILYNTDFGFIMLFFENIMFILFSFYQLYFCLNAIFHQNTMQIFAIIIINIGYVILGIVQIIEVRVYGDKFESVCPGLRLNIDFISYELPHIAVSVVITILIAVLSWKLYQQFGWNIYKRIGGDIEMQKRFRSVLIFAILLKIDLFFVILHNILITPYFIYVAVHQFNDLGVGRKIVIVGSISILVLVFFFQALAYKSIEKEWKAGIIVFFIFWIIVVLDFAYLAYEFGIAFVQFGLYSWIILMCIFMICAVLTFVYAIIIRRNFGKGLEEYLKNTFKSQGDERPRTFLRDTMYDRDERVESPSSSSQMRQLTID